MSLDHSDIDQRTGSIYTVHEVEGEGKVSRWKISGEGGEFKVMETFQSKGSHPCHVVVDAKHDLIFVANYCVKENGTMTAFSICPKEGTIKAIMHLEFGLARFKKDNLFTKCLSFLRTLSTTRPTPSSATSNLIVSPLLTLTGLS